MHIFTFSLSIKVNEGREARVEGEMECKFMDAATTKEQCSINNAKSP